MNDTLAQKYVDRQGVPRMMYGGIVMKSTGIVRKIDELGRIVLPIELRRTLDIEEKDSLEIYVDGASIILRKYEPSCVFCGDTEHVLTFQEKPVCTMCLKMLKEL